ncbi:GNAT family N-acetyltransferase [Rhodococcoides corynebacterioides]|uniref:N-acetyltransferase family protein n=1 Tax=Rhodococcoides corynebacterioides TaxID=53972 RepID=A0ABS7P3X3_9NOCA|nr:GNAT family N-acetyltransferase [Rhodococcus corynebacterioides]MBY6367109.1 N-acetyltransferase family protein [Rhodococcus corynebacterioides]MBY6407477.1 N-acetyltransferase family protein [Rhodococcus corynebacterioides]
MLIRDTVRADLPEILFVHNAAIADTTAIWDEELVDLAEREAWLAGRRDAGMAVLTAEIDGRVAGYASYGQYRPKSGYRLTVENSVYVADGFLRRGVATALMAELIARARTDGLHAMVAGIESTNSTSIALHKKFGFAVVGVMPQVGVKFGRWLDLTWMQLLLE